MYGPNHIIPIKNGTTPVPLRATKVYDPTLKVLVNEPNEVIEQSVDYRSMMLRSQIENGTLGRHTDFSTFGVNALDAQETLSNISSGICRDIERNELTAKQIAEYKAAMDTLFSKHESIVESKTE